MRNCQVTKKKNKNEVDKIKGGILTQNGVFTCCGGVGNQWNPCPDVQNYKRVLFRNSVKMNEKRKIH